MAYKIAGSVNKKRKTPKRMIALGVVVAVIAVVGILEATNTTNLIFKSRQHKDTTTKTTSDAPTAQEDFAQGDDREPNTNTESGEAMISDTNGEISSIPAENQWTSSANNAITVYSPAKNTTVVNGSVISGRSDSSTVSFRLIDNISGVIAQGELKVVNGTFSGKLSFATTATEGRLDIFNTKTDGVEFNNVEVPIRFK